MAIRDSLNSVADADDAIIHGASGSSALRFLGERELLRNSAADPEVKAAEEGEQLVVNTAIAREVAAFHSAQRRKILTDPAGAANDELSGSNIP